MSDYISREAAMEIVKRTSGDYAAAFSEIRKLPAADAEPVLQLHIRPWGKAALPSREELHRKEGENEKQETEFNIIALSLYSIY